MCRFGSRGAKAANQLNDADFTRTRNVLDGFDGGKVNDSDSYFKGHQLKMAGEAYWYPGPMITIRVLCTSTTGYSLTIERLKKKRANR